METLLIKATARTPAIKFDPIQGKLEIKGRSIPENAAEFYKPLIEGLNKYVINPKPVIQVDIQLEYLNTDSARCILNIFRLLESLQAKGNQVNINWYYEKDDLDMKEVGEDFREMVSLAFNLEQKKFS
ncbi:MAG TPA: DUF1987 domain-containing protein [Bacteroidia bacterium]|jgi:hypothetical protein|nr:DUF1987 domain-containing protein [Bacteroidia bacterium]